MYDFEAEYHRIFETPLEEIKEDIFFRADNFEIGVCKPEKDCVSDLQKALKVLGCPTQTRKIDGELFLIPQRERQKKTPPRHKQEMER